MNKYDEIECQTSKYSKYDNIKMPAAAENSKTQRTRDILAITPINNGDEKKDEMELDRQYMRRSLPRQFSTIISQHEFNFNGTTTNPLKHKKSKSLDPKTLEVYVKRKMLEEEEEDNEIKMKRKVKLRRRIFKLMNIKKWFTFSSFRWTYSLEWRSDPKFDSRVVSIANDADSPELCGLNIDESKIQRNEFINNKFKSAKYTIWNFVPYNLFEQFRRIANIYFALTLILTLILPDSPVSPESWLLSLILVICITMVKQGYEDYLRHKSDKLINNRMVEVVRDGKILKIPSKEIVVGDIVHLIEDEIVPCDVVVLSTSHDSGQCYLMTANLDGESSLKTKLANKLTQNIRTDSEIKNIVGCIECENPNPKLDNFLGRIVIKSDDEVKSSSLSYDNFLPFGTQLKNTKEVLAVCVYSGKQTKMSLNSRITKNKFSTIEKTLNKYLLFYGLILALEVVLSTILSFTNDFIYQQCDDDDKKMLQDDDDEYSYYYYKPRIAKYFDSDPPPKTRMLDKDVFVDRTEWYLGRCIPVNFISVSVDILDWLVLYNYLIPISLYVSLEFQKFFSSNFFRWDSKLRDDERDIEPICNTSDINEELGLVTHLFTDKTGTLTQNIMVFQNYTLDGSWIGDRNDLRNESWGPFMMVMTLCHSVQVDVEEFVASSPDEKALLEVCRESGYVYRGQTIEGVITIQIKDDIGGRTLKYKQLAELEFESYRKCMTVIVQEQFGDKLIHVLTKGAETTMLETVCLVDDEDKSEVVKIIDDFASKGLRTLVMGHKIITPEEFTTFDREVQLARESIIELNRTKYVRQAYVSMEREMDLIGATAIEDKLQEDVLDTLTSIRDAGIITWMLTGDKKETAINIGYASGLLPSSSSDIRGHRIVDISDISMDKDVYALIKQLNDEVQAGVFQRHSSTSLVIDGKTLTVIMKNENMKERLTNIADSVTSVIACRLSPIQKSQLVRMIKTKDTNNVTAAIGDGGNDVSMIQEAHVGLGIVGQEGKTASQAADFAFGKFKHLKRALLVHGHWYYVRLSNLVQYSFYKNVVCFTSQLYFAFYSNFSATSLYSYIFLFLYNTIYTMVPIIIYGLAEQNYSENKLLRQSNCYRHNHGNKLLGRKELFIWFMLGIWHASVIFFTWILAWDGLDTRFGLSNLGVSIAASSVILVNLKLLVEAKFYNLLLIISIIGSLGIHLILTLVWESWLFNNSIFNNFSDFRTYNEILSDGSFWFITVIIIIFGLLPDMILRVLRYEEKIFISNLSFRRKRDRNNIQMTTRRSNTRILNVHPTPFRSMSSP